RIAPVSQSTKPGPSGPSSSMITGVLLLGLSARNSGVSWSPANISTGSRRHSSSISSSAIAILRALGVGPPKRVIMALNLAAEPALQYLGAILPNTERSGAADTAGRTGKFGENALHPDLSEFLVGNGDERLARLEMRVGEHVLRVIDAARRNARLDHLGLKLVDGHRLGPFSDQRVKFLLARTTRAVRCKALV